MILLMRNIRYVRTICPYYWRGYEENLAYSEILLFYLFDNGCENKGPAEKSGERID